VKHTAVSSDRSAPPAADHTLAIPVEQIDSCILLLRGHKVILDSVLAGLYGVTTKALKQAVKRNVQRFPADFMLQLTWEEVEGLSRSQSVTLNGAADSGSQTVTLKRGANVKYRPYAFTEQGVAMLSSVLRSERAIAVNIEIMRAFVRLRQVLATHKELALKLAELEQEFRARTEVHQMHIERIYALLEALMEPPATTKKGRIGFRAAEEST
jgi:phage regulator Rha-like protein